MSQAMDVTGICVCVCVGGCERERERAVSQSSVIGAGTGVRNPVRARHFFLFLNAQANSGFFPLGKAAGACS
jgi:hypothetical protein